jgi:radical SAM superfamily enzyme YgiQ (UPF0313 family)
VDTLIRNPDLVVKMAKAGFKQVFIGIESVHQQSLDAMGKHTTPDMVRQAVRMLQTNGISLFGGVIVGYPGETAEMVKETVMFAKSLDMTAVQFTPITAFPGTSFHEEMKALGHVTTHDYRNYDLFHSMMGTDQLSAAEIYRLAQVAYATYYLDGDWIKSQKAYFNPFSQFSWMFKNMLRATKQLVIGGMRMFHGQGIHGGIAIPKQEQAEIRERMRRKGLNLSNDNVPLVAIPHQSTSHTPLARPASTRVH